MAKTITLYAEPQDKAKVVGTIDSNSGIIPIYTPEKGDWIKVADPRNGNVGWVKMNALETPGNTEYTFTQRFINTGSTPQSYQIIQFGSPNKMSSEQLQTLLQQNKAQQKQIQENINKMVNDMSKLYQWNNTWFNNDVPFVLPVIVIPAQTAPDTKSPKATTGEKNK
jgi:hypothetical protein